jgi:transposase
LSINSSHAIRTVPIFSFAAVERSLRGHLAEFGVIARNVGKLIAIVRDEGDGRLPDLARQVLQVLAAQIEQLEAAVAAIEKQLMAWHKSNPVSQRLASVPGIGPIIATALAATVVEPSGFRSGREFAAWLGLVPRQNSTGGKHRLGGISKRGNQYLRRLLNPWLRRGDGKPIQF